MALNNFIPEIWSARLLENLHKSLVYGQQGVINRDYEGDIRAAGDSVRINAIGPVTVNDYTKNSTSAITVQTLSDAQTLLTIDKQKYFAFQIDDVDQAQQKPKVMDAAMQEAGYALADAADQVIAALYSEIDTANAIGSDATPQAPSTTAGDTAYDYLVDLMVLLDEDNVPKQGRFVIIPPWLHGFLQKDDRFVKSGVQSAADTLANGEIGMAAGARILVSNNVPNTSATKYKIIAGHPIAWSYAEQVSKTEAYRSQDTFADVVRGLHLYGAKVVRPSALAVWTANKS